jgi:hypothetical protein
MTHRQAVRCRVPALRDTGAAEVSPLLLPDRLTVRLGCLTVRFRDPLGTQAALAVRTGTGLARRVRGGGIGQQVFEITEADHLGELVVRGGDRVVAGQFLGIPTADDAGVGVSGGKGGLRSDHLSAQGFKRAACLHADSLA